jgi:hypothetical protein
MDALMFMCNRKRAQVTVNVETIGRYEGEDPMKLDDFVPTSSMILSNVTILHVVSGKIKVCVDGHKEPMMLDDKCTLVCEQQNPATPTDVKMTPLLRGTEQVGLGLQSHPKADADDGDAVVIIIQVTYRASDRVEGLTSPLLPPTPTDRPKLARTNTGSVIVYDDQPWGILNPKQRDSIDFESNNLQTKFYGSAHHYKPPVFSDRFVNESQVPPAVIRDQLVIEEFPVGQISTAWINMVKQGLSEWIRIPVIVARGLEPGPVVGITAVVHGNELNGVPCIHRVISDIDVKSLKGTVVAVPCVNVPGYLSFKREFSDGKDLNRYFPGKLGGTASQVYNYNFFNKIVTQFQYLIDMHTASFGRVNSYYVRSDMNDPVSSVFAKLQQPQIILHNSGQDGRIH